MTTVAERILTRDDELRLMRHADELRTTLGTLALAGLEDSPRALELRAEREAVQAALAASRGAAHAVEGEQRKRDEVARTALAKRATKERQQADAAVALLEPLLRFPALKASVIEQAEKAGLDRAALRNALRELDAQDVGQFFNGRLGGGTHWMIGSICLIAGYGVVGPATL